MAPALTRGERLNGLIIMTCHDCREKLLRTLDPSMPSTEVAAHVAECDDCRQYQQDLLRIESNIARIPVPPSRGPEAFKSILRQLATAEPVMSPIPTLSRRSRRPLAWAMTVLAASVLVAVGIYWSMNRGGQDDQQIAKQPPVPIKDQPATYVAQLLDCNLSLAEDASPRQKAKAVAALTNLIQDAMESKPGNAPLQALAKMHHDTLFAGLLPIAQRMPPAEREEALAPIIDDLVRFHDEQVAVLAPEDPAEDKVAKSIAKDIRDIRHQLRDLLPAGVGQAKAPGQRRPRSIVTIDWKRDLPLIEALVTAGRKLALEQNPLKRAEQSHDLAEKMGEEIQQAAQVGDGARAAEYGHYVHALLTRAVASNMTLAQNAEPAPSQADLDRFARAVSETSKAIEADLKRTGAPNPAVIDAAVKAVSIGRLKVENSVKDKNRPPANDKK